jgi:predicted nucleic-acid-binding protein
VITVDTNILVRLLIHDDKQAEQIRLAKRFVEKHEQLFVPQIVQTELIWVLEFFYKFDKQQILGVLDHINGNEAFILQSKHQFEKALRLYRTSSADFSDCLILVESHPSEYRVVVTFDKKFAKLPGVKLLLDEKELTEIDLNQESQVVA